MQPSISETVQVALQCFNKLLSALFNISCHFSLFTNFSKYFKTKAWALQWHELKIQIYYVNGEKQNPRFSYNRR